MRQSSRLKRLLIVRHHSVIMYLKALLACHASSDGGMMGKGMNGETHLSGMENSLDMISMSMASLRLSSTCCYT